MSKKQIENDSTLQLKIKPLSSQAFLNSQQSLNLIKNISFPLLSESTYFNNQIKPNIERMSCQYPFTYHDNEYPTIADQLDNSGQLCQQPIIRQAIVPSYRIRNSDIYFSDHVEPSQQLTKAEERNIYKKKSKIKQQIKDKIKQILKKMSIINKNTSRINQLGYLIYFKQKTTDVPLSQQQNTNDIKLILYKVFKITSYNQQQQNISLQQKYDNQQNCLNIQQIIVQDEDYLLGQRIPITESVLIRNNLTIVSIYTNIFIQNCPKYKNIINIQNIQDRKIIILAQYMQQNNQKQHPNNCYIYEINKQVQLQKQQTTKECQTILNTNKQKIFTGSVNFKQYNTINELIKHRYYFQHVQIAEFYSQFCDCFRYQMKYVLVNRKKINQNKDIDHQLACVLDIIKGGTNFSTKFVCCTKNTKQNFKKRKQDNNSDISGFTNLLTLLKILFHFHQQLNLSVINTSYQCIEIVHPSHHEIQLLQKQSQHQYIMIFTDLSQLHQGTNKEYSHDIISLLTQVISDGETSNAVRENQSSVIKHSLICMSELKQRVVDILETVQQVQIIQKFKQLIKTMENVKGQYQL